MDDTITIAMAITIVSLTLWATEIIPAFITALIFFALMMLSGIASADVTFAGFTSSALWMIFSGLILGAAIEHTGLAQRMGRLLAIRLVGMSYSVVITGILGLSIALSFLMPSALGRVMLLVPIIGALADQLGFTHGTRGRTGMMLAMSFGVFLPAFGILPSNVPNMVWLGAIEKLFPHAIPTYGTYLVLHFPILGVMKSAIIIGIITILYHDSAQHVVKKVKMQPMAANEKVLLFLLLFGLLLWVTDFIHHISPAWIGLVMAILCLLPGSNLVPVHALRHHIDLRPFFYVAGIISLGVVTNHTGLGRITIDFALDYLPLSEHHPTLNAITLVIVSLIVSMITTLPGIPAVLTPLAPDLATASGLPLETVLMLQVIGFSTVLLPYQSPPLMVSLQLAKVSTREATRFCLILTFFTLFFLIPIDYFWWQSLGWI